MDDESRDDATESAPLIETDDDGNVVEPEDDEDPLNHGFSEIESGDAL